MSMFDVFPCILEVDVVDTVFSQTWWDLAVQHHAASRKILSVVLLSQRGMHCQFFLRLGRPENMQILKTEKVLSGLHLYKRLTAWQYIHSMNMIFTVVTCDSIYAIARICYGNSVCLSVCLSVTRVDQSKTVEARIMQFSLYSSPIPLVFRG